MGGKTRTRCKSVVQLIIADDRRLARESLRELLADEPDVEVVGEAVNGREALALCSRRPDLVVTDAGMPEGTGEGRGSQWCNRLLVHRDVVVADS